MRFWTELANEIPSQAVLEVVASDFQAAATEAIHHFEQLLAISPKSVDSLRSYAVFVSEVLNDPTTTMRLLQVREVRATVWQHVTRTESIHMLQARGPGVACVSACALANSFDTEQAIEVS